MKKITILIVVALFCNNVVAQESTTYQKFEFMKGDFSYFIGNYLLQKQSYSYDTLCVKSCAFISFLIKENGSIDSIACNIGTPKLLSDLFIEAVKSSEGNWRKVNLDKENASNTSQRFILPILYSLWYKKCMIKDNSFESIMKLLDFSGKPLLKDMPFLSNNLRGLNCILLGPTEFNSPIR